MGNFKAMMAYRKHKNAMALLMFKLKIFLRAKLRKYGPNFKDR